MINIKQVWIFREHFSCLLPCCSVELFIYPPESRRFQLLSHLFMKTWLTLKSRERMNVFTCDLGVFKVLSCYWFFIRAMEVLFPVLFFLLSSLFLICLWSSLLWIRYNCRIVYMTIIIPFIFLSSPLCLGFINSRLIYPCCGFKIWSDPFIICTSLTSGISTFMTSIVTNTLYLILLLVLIAIFLVTLTHQYVLLFFPAFAAI